MKFEKRSEVPSTARELFDWHARGGAFRRLAPPWQSMELLKEGEGLQAGKQVELKVGTPLGKRYWKAEHVSCVDGKEFVDTQVKGPFRSWTHRHSFVDLGDRRSELIDQIDYEPPGGRLGAGVVEEQLRQVFDYRHWVTQRDLQLRRSLPGFRRMKIAIAGGSGFLGTQLAALLDAQGHEVWVISRSGSGERQIKWDPQAGQIELARLEGVDAVINLAGASLMSGRWTEPRKRLLWDSRVESTRFLVDALLRLETPPSVFLSGSGISFYGDDDEASRPEGSPQGEGFLAELCHAWEAAALRLQSPRTRVCLLRTGLVMDPRGGALAQMLPLFKFGLGGPLGDGKQWFPWIALEDWIGAVNWLLFSGKAKGPMNVVAPESVRQKDFARSLGACLQRPSILPAPRFALKLAMGEMADEALLASVRAEPVALLEAGYPFCLPSLDAALRRCLDLA